MSDDALTRPVVPTGQEIYDLLMAEIEPDLVTANLETLDEKYADESEEETKNRATRYQKAFETYAERKTAYMADLHKQVEAYCKARIVHAEENSRVHEEQQLAELEKMMQSH